MVDATAGFCRCCLRRAFWVVVKPVSGIGNDAKINNCGNINKRPTTDSIGIESASNEKNYHARYRLLYLYEK